MPPLGAPWATDYRDDGRFDKSWLNPNHYWRCQKTSIDKLNLYLVDFRCAAPGKGSDLGSDL